MGVCASYYETSAYINAFMNAGSPNVNEEAFIQHVFDNADVNVRTLYGLNTFHAMGEYNVLRQLLALKPKKYSGTFNPKCIRKRSYPKKISRRGLSSIVVKDYNVLKGAINSSYFTLTTIFPLNSI
ncbi:hypothetical protein PR048_015226 [Dryococelus australis]|uniref:Uncharacterized protein n=1 Tax=Dryococelus australis TaxID=614101 RepID=A0ABQ9HGD0_9NEOP|nr:hypothetical protein PR048_015226 [Dryococelus australis]